MSVSPKDVIEKIPAASIGMGQWGSVDAYHFRYTGAADMVRIAELGADRRELHDFSYFYSDPDWIGRKFSNFAEIVKAVDGTWKEGCARVEEMSRELESEELPRPTVIKRRRVWDEYAGDEICIDRYRSGDPFFRDNLKVRSPGPRLINFLVQLGANSERASDDLFWRGALAITLARIVEDAGYRSEITAFATVKHGVENPSCPHILTTCELKGAGDSLDISSLVNVTSGWFFRTVMFASWTAPGEVLDDHLGSMKEATPEVVEYLASGARPWVISGIYNKRAALARARELLAELVKESR
jgi:hypothetical protein